MDNRRGVDLCDVESYAYDLPEELIAQNPAARREESRLMRLGGAERAPQHCRFSDLPQLLRPGDLLVMNDTRVLRARLRGRKLSAAAGTSGAAVEIFCLAPTDDRRVWKAMVRPGRKLLPGSRVSLQDQNGVADGKGILEVTGRIEDGLRLVRLPDALSPEEVFARYGRLPLPPYIRSSTAEDERYQTVYADREKERSVAAPTAGLHFTQPLLAELRDAGVDHVFITLDVGAGTFRPIKVRDVREHHMHTERCAIGAADAERINAARAAGRRIVAVGTTVVRTLESFADESGRLAPGERDTDIFIRPGYRFRAVDAMITNFHLPGSTLLMLVAAFAGYDRTMAAYREAVERRYRFFSFGDAMLIEPCIDI